jgi:hypothetical protein
MLPLHFNHLSPLLLSQLAMTELEQSGNEVGERMQRNFSLSPAASGTPLLAGAAFFSKLQLALWRGAAIITTAADIYIRVYCNWRDAAAAGNSRNNCPAFSPHSLFLVAELAR